MRLRQAILKCSKEEAKVSEKRFKKHYDKIRTTTGGELRIKSYAQRVHGVENVSRDIERLNDFNPDVIFYDYIDVMGGKEKDKRLRIQENYYAASATNKKYDCFCVSVSKLTRGGQYKDINTVEDIAEDSEKSYNADAIFALSRTKEDVEDGVGRIVPILLRDGQRSFDPVEIEVDFEKMNINKLSDYAQKERGTTDTGSRLDTSPKRLV